MLSEIWKFVDGTRALSFGNIVCKNLLFPKTVIKSQWDKIRRGINLKIDKNFLFKAGFSLAIFAWLLYTMYSLYKSVPYLARITSDIGFVISNGLTTFLVVDVFATLGLALRVVAGAMGLYIVFGFLRGKEFSKLVKLIGIVVSLEAAFFLTFIPSIALGVELGGVFYLIETTIPCIVMSFLMPATLLIFRSKLSKSDKSYYEALRWACVAGIAYLVMFWINFNTQWIATVIQPQSLNSAYTGYTINDVLYPGHGLSYITNYPLNTFTFLLTSVGLTALIGYAVWISLPTLKDPSTRPNTMKVGVALTLLGSYFLTIIGLYYTVGPVGGQSIWTMWFMYSNLDNYATALPFLGIPLILISREKRKFKGISNTGSA